MAMPLNHFETCGRSDLRPCRAREPRKAGCPRVLPWAGMLRAFSAGSRGSWSAPRVSPNSSGHIRPQGRIWPTKNPREIPEEASSEAHLARDEIRGARFLVRFSKFSFCRE